MSIPIGSPRQFEFDLQENICRYNCEVTLTFEMLFLFFKVFLSFLRQFVQYLKGLKIVKSLKVA